MSTISIFLNDHDVETLAQPLNIDEAKGNLRALFQGEKDEEYTIIMYDPDALSPENSRNPSPSSIDEVFDSYLHYLIINIPGGSYGEGDILMPYTPPSPPQGIHHYQVDLYQQGNPLQLRRITSRQNFSVTAFVTRHHLKMIDRVIFRVKADD